MIELYLEYLTDEYFDVRASDNQSRSGPTERRRRALSTHAVRQMLAQAGSEPVPEGAATRFAATWATASTEVSGMPRGHREGWWVGKREDR